MRTDAPNQRHPDRGLGLDSNAQGAGIQCNMQWIRYMGGGRMSDAAQPTPRPPIVECDVLLCADCRKESGNGNYVRIRYSNSGGWSPKWEGRLCEHLTVEDAVAYYEK